jgi:hypothetical protein
MANTSIYAAFERLWQHIIAKLNTKIDKTEIATNDEVIDMLAQEDMLPAVVDSDGGILSDENGNVILW